MLSWITWSLYCTIPIGWLGLLIVALIARKRMNRLEVDQSPLPHISPSLAIVVPARNEAEGIEDCVSRLLQQDYPAFELHVINDRSTDDTGAILDRMASTQPRVRVRHVDSLPPGWLGKCHALSTGTRGISSDWILFVDSDVKLEPFAARRMVALAHAREYDALSVLPRIEAPSLWERLLLPPLAFAWGAMFRISQTNEDSRPDHAFANGQLFLIKREVYERVGNHEAVRDQIVEDVMLMRVMKRAGARCRLMIGPSLGRTRMQTNLKSIFHGWARILAGSSGRSMLPIVVAIVLCIVNPIALGAGIWMSLTDASAVSKWWVPTLMHAGIWFGMMMWCYRGAGLRMREIAWLAITWPMMTAVLINALRVCVTGRVDWRGNAVVVNRKGV